MLDTLLHDISTFVLTVHNSFITWKGGAQGLRLLIKMPEQAPKLNLCKVKDKSTRESIL